MMERRQSKAEEGFVRFFQKSYHRVFRGAFAACGDWSVAEEATQEAFARAYARWRRLRDAPWVEGWVMTTALNESRKLVRQAGRTRALAAANAIPNRDATDFTDSINQRDTVRLAILDLPERERTALILFYLCNQSTASIAELMGCAESTVRSHLTSARQGLGGLLGAKEDDDGYA